MTGAPGDRLRVGSGRRSAPAAGFAAALIVLLPRLARLAHPEVWTEDSVHLYHAFAWLAGARPFLDGIHAHPPLPEAVLALAFSLFGVGIRVAEIVTALLVIGAGWLVYDIARRETDSWTALVAPAAVALSPLLVRYHVYEREVFTLALAALAFWIVRTQGERRSAAAAAGAVAGLALCAKLSGAALLPPLLAYFLTRREPRAALHCALGAIAVAGTFWAGLLLAYGDEAFLQLVLLHLVDRGEPAPFQNATVLLLGLSYVLVLGGLGIAIALRRDARGIALAAAILACEVIGFYVFISGTIWPHNLIELLLPLSLGLIFAAHALGARRRLAAALLVTALTLDFAMPASWSWVKGDWGYVPRAAISEAAAFLRENVPESTRIAAPHYLAAEAQRRKLVHYRELRGPVDWLRDTLARDGIAALGSQAKLGSWMEMVDETSGPWRAEVEDAIRARALGAIVTDLVSWEWEFVEAIRLPPEERDRFYAGSGYRLAYESEHYRIWLPDPARSPPPD